MMMHIPETLTDYYKILRMFRGNYVKGEALLIAMLDNPDGLNYVLEAVPALAAIFSGFNRSAATRLLYDTLRTETPYFERAFMNYFKGLHYTTYDTFDELLADAQNTMSILRNERMAIILTQDPPTDKKMLTKYNIYRALPEDENSDIAIRDDVLRDVAAITQPKATNIYGTFNIFASALVNQAVSWGGTEVYYTIAFNNVSGSLPIAMSDTKNVIYIGVGVRTRSAAGTTTYYNYPGICKYDIPTDTWSLLYVGSTAIKDATTTNNSRQTNGVAYDEENNRLYMFYRPDSTTAQNYCDVINSVTGTAIRSNINVGSTGAAPPVSSTSPQTPWFCTFDKVNKLAKYMWQTGVYNAPNDSTAAGTYGWLWGCSVNENGMQWSGKACHPRMDLPALASFTVGTQRAPSNAQRFGGGMICGTYQEGASAGTGYAYLITITSKGNRINAQYLQFPAGTNHATLSGMNSTWLCDNGFLLCQWNATIGGNARQVSLYDFTENGLITLADRVPTSNPTSRIFPEMNKVNFNVGNTDYSYFGRKDGSYVESKNTQNYNTFITGNIPLNLGTERYKLIPYSASNWTLYDYDSFLWGKTT
jgi:hypothetical protein